MADFDDRIRASLHRLAEPGDPTGVVAAVEARVAAGDPGTVPDSGAGSPGAGFWVLSAGLVVAAAAGGVAVGASGLLGPSAAAPSTTISTMAVTTPGLGCPAGAPVVAFRPGDRVLAVARDATGAWLAVRSPVDRADTVWVAAGGLVPDPGQPDATALPVAGCPAPQLAAAPTPTPEPGPPRPERPRPPAADPGPQAPPADPVEPPPDTTPPTLGTPARSTDRAACGPGFPEPETVTITVAASDDRQVQGVRLSYSGADTGGPLAMTRQGGSWTFVYDPGTSVFGTVTFQLVAVDGTGNASPAKSISVDVNCLI